MIDYGDFQDFRGKDPDVKLTFHDFIEGRRWSDDLDAEGIGADDVGPGWIYPGGLWIEQVTDDWSEKARARGKWYLMLERDEWIGDLFELERILFGYGVKYGHLAGIEPSPRTIN